ncbi:uncharacterized protein LOC130823495 [Amaranthus tricolor]|uniref:uncharacterized protein LOC130823495 n=1 Tax=Amaranthus tricolor TaxID=29722 RepID=UPI002590A03F|nr:uncharacterized protein LOC130823495 [Amaranthus tricolor]
MAYYYNSDYPQSIGDTDTYQFYYNDQYNYNNDDSIQEPRYVQFSDTEFYGNAYQHAPTPSLVGYYYSTFKNANLFNGNGEYYYDLVSTEYIVSYNVNTPEETNAIVEDKDQGHDPKTHGGDSFNGSVEDDEYDDDDDDDDDDDEYDDYGDGKGLPVNEVQNLGVEAKQTNGVNSVSKVIQEEKSMDVEKDDDGDDGDGKEVHPVKEVQNLEAEEKQTNGVNSVSKVIQEEKSIDLEDDGDHYEDEDEDDYDDDDDDDDDDDEGGGEKQDDSVKEPLKNDPIVPLVGVLPLKEVQNLGVEAKPKNINEEKLGEAKPKKVTFVDEVILQEKALDLEENEEQKKKNDLGGISQQKKALNLEKQVDKDEVEDEDKDEDKDKDEGKNKYYLEKSNPREDDNDQVEDEDEDEEKGDFGDKKGRKEEDFGNNNQIKRQMPYGYGIEALDICEGLFGSYFPCLWKRNQRVYNHERDVNDNYMNDYDYCCKETVDYLFGNPNPYGGSMPEKGSYGDPVYCYQKHHPQQPVTEHVQGTSSWENISGCYCGLNGSLY